MYDPTDDIEKSKIGKRKEPLHDITHKEKAKTNLSPMVAKNARFAQPILDICEYPKCNYMQITGEPAYDGGRFFICDKCGKKFCEFHASYKNHKCLEDENASTGLMDKIKDVLFK
jgi:uncharacterized protein (DUF2147 family)